MIRFEKIDFDKVYKNIPRLKDVFDKYCGKICAVYVFGSLNSNKTTTLSDIDIGILFNSKISNQEMIALEFLLLSDISKTLGTDEIDLLVMNSVPLSIQYGVLKNKSLIYCGDRLQTVNFEHETVLKYLDILPYREEMNIEFLKMLN